MEKYDVVILGGATSGAYFANKMAKKGYRVKILEALTKKKLGTRMDIFHVSQTDLKTYDMPAVKEGDPEWAFEFTDNHFSSPSDKYLVPTTSEIVGLHMHEYVALMVKIAVESGAEIEYSARFNGFIFEDGKIVGVKYSTPKGESEIFAKTIVDCSGSSAVGRRALPADYGIENFELADDDMFYVILRYAKFKTEQINTFWLNTKSWTAPFSMDPTEKIIGTGATESFKKVEETYAKLDMSTGNTDFELIRTEKGTTPYRRPPYSLVADNFIVTGDAACLTKPDCGEGVTSSMVMMDIAAEVLDKALKLGDTGKKALWKINKEYSIKQGADFCLVRAFLTKVVKAKDSEIEYFFANKLIANETFLNNGRITAKDIVSTVGGLTRSIAGKHLSKETLGAILNGAKLGILLRQHYINFPDDPKDFDKWCRVSDLLWEKVGKMQ